jgi:hypothetical protein
MSALPIKADILGVEIEVCLLGAKSRHRRRFEQNSNVNPKGRSLPQDWKKNFHAHEGVGNFLLICASILSAIPLP